MSEKNQQFPNALEAFFLWVGLMGLEYLLGAALYDLHLGLGPWEASAITEVLAFGALFAIVMQVKGLDYPQLFHGPAGKLAPAVVLLVAPICMLAPALMLADGMLSDAVIKMFPMSSQEAQWFDLMAERSPGAFVAVCLLAPMLEEMLFRGVVLRSFLRQYPRWPAIVGSATLFGFVHLNLYQFIGATIFGVLAGWMYERSRSLIPCIAMHFINNFTFTMLSWDMFPGAERWQASPALVWFVALLLAAGGAVLLRWLLPLLPLLPLFAPGASTPAPPPR